MMINKDYVEKLEEALKLLNEIRLTADNSGKYGLYYEANEAITCIENVIEEL